MRARVGAGFAEKGNGMDAAATEHMATLIGKARDAQQAWAGVPLQDRLRILRGFRHALAESADDIAATIPNHLPGSLQRTHADTLVSEVLPLAEACRFLEREATSILAPYSPGSDNRPFWLRGVSTEIRREPIGIVLIIGPGNYPLFLPGVQALQGLAAGNAVLWKPAHGGGTAAKACRLLLIASGIDPSLLQVLEEAPTAATAAIRSGVDKVFLTGSAATGTTVLHELAETLTPSVMELSGCDAVFVLDGADLGRTAEALAFGMRLNGSATCMAPRRVFATTAVAERLGGLLEDALSALDPVHVPEKTSDLLQELMFDAENKGAHFRLNGFNRAIRAQAGGTLLHPTLVTQATADMDLCRTDLFAPVLSIIEVSNEDEAIEADSRCPYALTAAVFGRPHEAQRLASRIPAGSVLINDIIVSTADPRAPFGGRKRSGFGATRGREGLLEMTTFKTIQTQIAKDRRAYAPPTPHHSQFIAGYIRAAHGGSWRSRMQGAREFLRAMMKLK
ncbi:putative aldehyde dehydrogenase (NAD+) [Acidisarcina polymorpha]|uniref:Putative aldehyde dehydrogenase (NAD+) n=1 Tax=Acidisarcina polymorpha TaxID=2211140 RepID=A0A2Z5G2A8_9BACT|nr:aldehyde dehydrogenase family protein [Acidisarcina polymorpha]AXC12954.1 putative aldehyde dehydrogenase (NAD+) [Acidisarcina polymorpha]